MSRERIRKPWNASDSSRLASGASRGTYYTPEEPPLVGNTNNTIGDLRSITEWAARELRRLKDEALIGLEDTICLSTYDAQPARGSESNLHGGIKQLVTAGVVSSGASLVVTQGLGKMFLVINTGPVSSGIVKVKGTIVDRDTGAESIGTSTITLSGLTTDSSTIDANGNVVHSFTRAYITNKWFRGTCTVSTAIADINDIDVYHCSFEQFNDNRNLWYATIDVNLLATNANAKFDAYLYTVIPNGSKLDITAASSINLGTPITDRYYRLRRGYIDVPLDGAKDGVFVDVHYSNSPAYIEDMTLKVWASRELA